MTDLPENAAAVPLRPRGTGFASAQNEEEEAKLRALERLRMDILSSIDLFLPQAGRILGLRFRKAPGNGPDDMTNLEKVGCVYKAAGVLLNELTGQSTSQRKMAIPSRDLIVWFGEATKNIDQFLEALRSKNFRVLAHKRVLDPLMLAAEMLYEVESSLPGDHDKDEIRKNILRAYDKKDIGALMRLVEQKERQVNSDLFSAGAEVVVTERMQKLLQTEHVFQQVAAVANGITSRFDEYAVEVGITNPMERR